MHEEKTTKKSEIKNDENSEDLKSLIEKNLKWSQVIYEQNRKIKRRLTMMAVGSYLRLALILVPIVLALIYLPPLFEQLWKQYSPLLGAVSSITGKNNNPIENIMSQFSGKQIQGILQNVFKEEAPGKPRIER